MRVKVSVVAFSKNDFLVQSLLQHFPDAEVNATGKRFKKEELIRYFSDADAAIVGLEKIDDELLQSLPKLRMIAKYGVGLDNIDLDACKKRGVQVGWTGGVNKVSVAEMTIGFMLMLCRNLYITSNQLKTGTWNKSGGVQLSGKTIGIIGLGNIGKELIRFLKPFNCRILGNDIVDMHDYATGVDIEIVDKDKIFRESDILTIHTPLTSQTQDMINKAVFKRMKSGSFLINTARGGIVNEKDLKWALQNQVIAGAALDVYNQEPPEDKELLSLPNLICTPHIGGNAYEAVVAMGESAIAHLMEFRKKYFHTTITNG